MSFMIGAQPGNPVAAADYATSGRAFGLGDRYEDSTGNAYVFAKAASGITAGQVVYFDTSYNATLLSTSNDARGNAVGVAPAAFSSGDYGWFQVRGLGTASVLASAAANARLNTTATAGSLDDDGTVGSMQVQGIYLTTANGGSTAAAACILNNPYIDVTL